MFAGYSLGRLRYEAISTQENDSPAVDDINAKASRDGKWHHRIGR